MRKLTLCGLWDGSPPTIFDPKEKGISKVVLVDSEKEFLFIEGMQDGTYRLTTSKAFCSYVGALSSIRISPPDGYKEAVMSNDMKKANDLLKV